MHGIKVKSGVNDCYFNIDGKCMHKDMRAWNCVFTMYGVRLCGGYIPVSLVWISFEAAEKAIKKRIDVYPRECPKFKREVLRHIRYDSFDKGGDV